MTRCKTLWISIAILLLSSQVVFAQYTSYSSLFTSGSFTKSININLAVGTVGAVSDATSGAASYSIPIVAPPGTNGVSPSIAIDYNSSGGNGVVGRGWNISGLSAITRVGQTIYHDGSVKPLELGVNDRFALNGSRLMLKAGTYGANATTYGTELENFSIITSNGDLGGGPLWFSEITKDGLTIEYGNTTDSRLLNADNTKVLFWRINKISYQDGNYIEFKYISFDRDLRIDEINYTGNVNAGLAPYNRLKFTYAIRSDINTTYEAGVSIGNKYLLDKIIVTAEGAAAFKTYTFNYATNNNINSFLKEVIEAGSDGSTLNSTIFKYGDIPPTFQTGTSSAIQNQGVTVFPGDVNGDGYSDIIACTKTTIDNITYHTDFKVYHKNPSPSDNTFTLSTTVALPANYIAFKPYEGSNHNQMVTDFNGDMAQDLIFTKTTGTGSSRVMSEIRVYNSPDYTSPVILTPYNSWNIVHTSSKYFLQGDFNGDGRTDILTMLGQSTSLYRTAIYYGGDTYWTDTGILGTSYFTEDIWPTVDRIDVLDFNGDGKDDIMLIKDDKCEIFNFSSSQFIKRIYFSGFPTKWHMLFFGDFNGDGKTDILSRASTTNNNAAWYKSISTGIGFVETPFTFNHQPNINNYYGEQLFIADFNGDGKMDISHIWNNFVGGIATTSNVDNYYSKGDEFFSEQYAYSKLVVSEPNLFTFDADGDGRSDIFNRNCFCNPFDIVYFNKEGKDLLLHKAKNGVDHTTEWTYKRMTEAGSGSFYSRGVLTSHPFNNVQLPIDLVYELKTQNGIGGTTVVQYNYEEAKLHKEGKGFLGLKRVFATNSATGMKTVNELEFNTTYYIPAAYKTSLRLASNSTLLNETTYTNQFQEQGAGSKIVWVKLTSTGFSIPFENRYGYSNNIHDAYGNVTQNVSTSSGIETVTTSTIYGAYGTPIPAKPTSTTVTQSRSGTPSSYSFTNTYGWNSLGQMISQTEFSGLPQSVTTTYTYNSLGNQTGMTISPSGMTARTNSSTYDSKGRYEINASNALGQSTSATYDPKWGKPLSITGIDGLITSFTYDVFGRLKTTVLPTSFTVTESYGWDINASEGTIHYQLTSHPGKPDKKVWYDLLDREKKVQAEGFQNEWITTNIAYDARGNVATSTAPYKASETILTTTTIYDTYNRLSSVANTLGTTNYGYSYDLSGNLTTTITNPASQVSSKITDPASRMSSATDYGGTLSYIYNSQGNLIEVKRGTTILTTNEYDAYGRQTKLIDINAGSTQYAYNALDELISQTSALAQTTTFGYDLLGRMTQRVGPEGTTTYEYFPSASGTSTNKIKKIIGFAGDINEYTYDAYGRVSTDKTTIDAVAHTTSYTYNTYNDVTSSTYPSGFVLNSTYDANGYLSTLKNGGSTITLFSNTGMNGFNQYKTYSLGNGKTSSNTYYFGVPTRYYTTGIQDLNLTWNYQSGNLTSRNDAIKSKTESFTYDNLNRLMSSFGTGLSSLTFSYGANGNIDFKTHAGTYTYDASKINAVNNISNATTDIPLLTQDVIYSPFFQPTSITEGTNQLSYTYGADQQRIKGVLIQNGSTTNTRYYFGSYEKDITGSSTKHIHYIDAGQGLIAIVVRENGVDTYNYAYTDHLGSILSITNSSGIVTTEQNFDAWGRLRNPSTWVYTSVPTAPTWLYRGYAGHEHLPQFSLINMNGRLYDPIIGRMLSVDNFVQMPGYTQSYNRYSYAFNNPLKFNDPDGEWIHIVIGAAIGGIVNGIAHADRPGGFWKGFAIGAVAGAVTAAIGPAAVASAGYVSTSGIITGAISGASGAVLGSAVQGIGNAVVFGDQYTAKQWGKDILLGGVSGGVIGGASALISNARGIPTNMLYGGDKLPDRSIWSFARTPNYANASGNISIGEITGQSDELLGGKPFVYSKGSSSLGAPNVGPQNLYHYTNEAGYKAILESGELWASSGAKNTRYGTGQYLTDIAPSDFTVYQTSRRLFGLPWNKAKLTHFFEIDVTGLSVVKNATYNYLVPGSSSLPLNGRILSHGKSVFSVVKK